MNAKHFLNEENKDIINRFLFIGDKFMPEMHLWDPKNQKRINDFKKTVLKSKALKIALDPKVNGAQRGLASMVYKCFNERTKGSGIKYNKKII